MKRFICLFLSICMVCLNLPLISLAADTPSLTIECPKEVIPGEETDITVTLSNASDYTALEYCLTYDPEKFEIVSITEGDDFFFYFPIINPSYSDNQAHFSFALNSPCSTNGVVMTAKVRAKSTAAGVADFKIEHCKMSDGDMQPIMVSLDSKQTTIKTAQFSISSDVDKAISEDTVTAVISLIDGSAFSNFDYDVVYDNDKLEVISAKAYSKFEAIAQVNPEIAKNKIHMNFAAGRNFNYSGELMTVVFKVKNNTAGKAELSIDGALLVDENEKNLPVAIVGASIDIECTHKGVEWVEAKPANCKEDGLKEFKCDCGYYDSKSIPKGKHNYIPTIVPATKDTKGYTRYTCDGCQDSYEDDYVPALGYDVVFDANGGEFDVESQNKQPDASLILTDKEPARTGYTFEGWAKNKTADVAEYMPGDTYSVNEDVTLYAVWKINKYKIIYMIDGDTYKEYELEYNTEIVPEAAPVKEGYTFSSWSEIPSKMPANTVTVTGSFAANKHDIIYIVDGEEYKRVTLSYGSSVTPEQEPEKEGYTFSGWNGLPTLMPDNDVTVTGTFAVNKYKLVYKVDGAEYSSEEIEYGTPLAPKPLPTREGHTFSGWSEVPATMPAKDITVVGTFAVNKYKLVYKVDGAEYSSEEIEYGTSITPKASPTKEGYTFSGWSEVPATMPAKDVTVTGTFTINKYKLIYKVDGAEYSSEDVEFGASIVPKAAPTKEGYTFSGWSEIPSTMPARDITVTGVFTVNKYKLVYKVDGAEVSSEDVEFGSSIIPKAAPAKEGYTFSGWSEIPSTMPAKDITVTGSFAVNKYKLIYKVDDAEYASEDVEFGASIVLKETPVKEGYTFSGWSEVPATMPAKDVTVTGKFTINKYKLVYKVDGAEYKKVSYDYNAEILPEEAPIKDGYLFVRWENIPLTMPANDVEVTAIWERAFTVSGKAFFNDVATEKIEISVNSKTIVTNESGEYRIEKIVPGTYTITAKRGAAEASTTITIADSDIIVDDIKLTTIIIKEDYSGTKVIGIETLKEAFNEADKEYIAADDYNTITLDVTAREKDVDALENAADIRKAIPSGYKNDLYYVAISMKKNRTGNETDEKNIITSEVLHKVVIEIPDSMKNKQAYTIIRSTNGMVDTLTTTENSAGEKIEVSDGKIYVYTNAIDGFAIAYKQRSSSHFGGSSGVSRVSAVASSISDKEVMIGTKVSLTTVTKEATIYYTLDGTVPNQNSLVYSEPIMLTEDVTIKAIAVKRGMSDSLVSTFVYAVKHAEISLASPDKYMDAYDDRTFKPDKAIARYEVIKALSNVFNIQKTNLEISFNDVSEEYAELVGLFAGASIIDGYEDETFRGNNGITRAELVKILSIMLKVDVSSKESNFTDIKGHWAEEYINSFVELKYILGYPDGTFKPDNNISRAEFVVIINRIIKLSADPTKNLTDVDDTHWAYNEITIATK